MHLETLWLGQNAIGNEGVSALTRALAENRALRRQVCIHVPYVQRECKGVLNYASS